MAYLWFLKDESIPPFSPEKCVISGHSNVHQNPHSIAQRHHPCFLRADSHRYCFKTDQVLLQCTKLPFVNILSGSPGFEKHSSGGRLLEVRWILNFIAQCHHPCFLRADSHRYCFKTNQVLHKTAFCQYLVWFTRVWKMYKCDGVAWGKMDLGLSELKT